ncbi:MAG: cytochrome c oxidase subunit 3 [Acetobacteraceae bacterium]|nr:cytochrome c oxidase subunit 3 [Acetobacteraceae bacterium]
MDTNLHTASVPASSGLKQPYHLVDPSPWPIIGALGGFLTVTGIVVYAHFNTWWLLILGLVVVIGTAFMWWRDVIRESRTPGLHSPVVRLGLRYGMTLFIASEVMFFVGFFWAYFNFFLYPENVSGATTPMWPPAGVVTFDPFHLPFLNTMILLLSGTTITWAHHSLLEKDGRGLIMGLGLTILLGLSFTTFQAIEYSDAPFKFTGGVYPSVFFLATGFHGFHVIVGTIFLIVCWFRARAGQFNPERHFGFEAAAWYWHFVDVVWLFLFVCIYWIGASAVTSTSGP